MVKRLIEHAKRNNYRQLLVRSWSVCWPMTLIMFFLFLLGLCDVYVAGKIGKEVQASYGFVNQLYFMFVIVVIAVNVGSVSLISKLFASGKKEKTEEAISTAILTSAIAGAVLGVACFFVLPFIVRFLSVPPVIKHYAIPLFRIYALGIVFHYLIINTNGILRSCKRVTLSLRTMVFVCILNITLNFFLVFYTPLGYAGIAIATITSLCVGAIMNMMHLRTFVSRLRKISFPLVKKIFSIGWPIGLLQFSWQMVNALIYVILGKLPSQNIEVMAAFTNGMRLESAIFLPAFAFNLSNAVIIGNLLGEKKSDEAYHNGIVTACAGMIIVLILTAIVILNAGWFLSFLSNDQTVIREGITYVRITMCFEPLMAWGIILAGALSGAGDTKKIMYRVAGSLWLIRIPLCVLFVVILGFGPVAVWWSMAASIVVQTVLITQRYFSKKWCCAHEAVIPDQVKIQL